ncbi:hypothetical protein EIP91_008553 [Steccherinum ochraceum]|uniref:DnaJ homologue subfamily C member 28 conserved domain-containing protein n=1 Tax=Steccherinum ochraceum TaxID=92696 RepID=A0A4R0R5E3_9APHY|nr:hypothetical protein EIP91_008553 [Steccherinum ochraceum]
MVAALQRAHLSTRSFQPLFTPNLHRRPYSNVPKPTTPDDHRASSQLFADAAKEDAAAEDQARRASRLNQLETQHENWTGDESIQDAVLRMLVDKYKPLRNGTIRTAEEKIKEAPPKLLNSTSSPSPDLSTDTDYETTVSTITPGSSVPPWQTSADGTRPTNMASVPLLPSIEGHQPWHTTFRAPSHATSSVKYGSIPPAPRRTRTVDPLDEKAVKKEREKRKRTEMAGRLSGAKESALDYRLGVKGKAGAGRRPNPVTLKGWASLVEERIEKARLEGQFNTLKGRGKPLVHITDEKNPFIAREEFLMNRIVQRNGAAPPWVEIQGELESAATTFREVVKQSWTRRAIRMLTISQPTGLLPKLTVAEAGALQDAEWEARERAYHDSAIDELNSLVRKYNGLAPYAVRRPYYLRSAELEKAYRDSAEDILRGIAERVNAPLPALSTGSGYSEDIDPDGDQGARGSASTTIQDSAWVPLRLRDIIMGSCGGYVSYGG